MRVVSYFIAAFCEYSKKGRGGLAPTDELEKTRRVMDLPDCGQWSKTTGSCKCCQFSTMLQCVVILLVRAMRFDDQQYSSGNAFGVIIQRKCSNAP